MKKKIISALTAFVLMFGAAFCIRTVDVVRTGQDISAASYASSELAEYAEQVAILVNQERAAYGLQPLKVSPKLSEAATIRAEELKQSFSHTRPNGTACYTAMSERGITYSAAAENIAYGQRTPEIVMNGWMNSSGHRANILNPNMTYIGVGVAYHNSVYYWSQFFAVSNNLSDGAYIPGDSNSTVTTSAKEVTTTAPKTTAPAKTTVSTAKKQTSTLKTTTTTTISTTQKTTASQAKTTVKTTAASKSTTVKPKTTKPITTSADPVVTTAKQTRKTCAWTTACTRSTCPKYVLPDWLFPNTGRSNPDCSGAVSPDTDCPASNCPTSGSKSDGTTSNCPGNFWSDVCQKLPIGDQLQSLFGCKR